MASGITAAGSAPNEFEDLTVSFSRVSCNGTINSPLKLKISKDRRLLWISGGRVTITGFSRTGANPGIAGNAGLPSRSSNFDFYCGFRFDNTTARPEPIFARLYTDGRIGFFTNETYTNASGNPLHLMISSCMIPLE